MTEDAVRPLLDPLPAGRVSFTPWGALASYYRFLETIDIGIAPLAPTPYNRCLADTRFMEYAAHGVLAVCADLEPYREVVRPGETGYLFADAAELETVLERALVEGDVRAAIPARAARYAASERLERRHAARSPRLLPVRRRADGIRDQGPPPDRLSAVRPSRRTPRRDDVPGFALPDAGRGRGRAVARGRPAPQARGRDRRGAPLLPRRRAARAAQPPAPAVARRRRGARGGDRGAVAGGGAQPDVVPGGVPARREAAGGGRRLRRGGRVRARAVDRAELRRAAGAPRHARRGGRTHRRRLPAVRGGGAAEPDLRPADRAPGRDRPAQRQDRQGGRPAGTDPRRRSRSVADELPARAGLRRAAPLPPGARPPAARRRRLRGPCRRCSPRSRWRSAASATTTPRRSPWKKPASSEREVRPRLAGRVARRARMAILWPLGRGSTTSSAPRR